MTTPDDIMRYNAELDDPHHWEIADLFCEAVTELLPDASGKVWHGHPVWFLDGNPIVGYHLQKGTMKVLFWSGQSFDEPDFVPVGKFTAAGFSIPEPADFGAYDWETLLGKARDIQWDYGNLPKNRELRKLTDF